MKGMGSLKGILKKYSINSTVLRLTIWIPSPVWDWVCIFRPRSFKNMEAQFWYKVRREKVLFFHLCYLTIIITHHEANSTGRRRRTNKRRISDRIRDE